MAEEREAGQPGRSRLPGFDEYSGRGYRGDYGDRGELQEAFEKAAQAARKELGKVTLADLAGKKGK